MFKPDKAEWCCKRWGTGCEPGDHKAQLSIPLQKEEIKKDMKPWYTWFSKRTFTLHLPLLAIATVSVVLVATIVRRTCSSEPCEESRKAGAFELLPVNERSHSRSSNDDPKFDAENGVASEGAAGPL